jgi:hypothetical protein
MNKYLLIILLFACPVMAQYMGEFQDSIEITTLPYTISTSDTCYYLSGDLVSDADGIFCNSADRFRLNFCGYSIRVDTAGNGGDWGIRLQGNDSFDIVNGTVEIDPVLDTTASGSHALWGWTAPSNMYSNKMTYIAAGLNSQAVRIIELSGDAYNILFDSCTITSNATAYTSRCAKQGDATQCLDTSKSLTGDQYHYKFRQCIITNTPQSGIMASGKVIIDTCNITGDARNDLYSYPSSNICEGTVQSYGIHAYNFHAGSRIVGCEIRAGQTYGGLDGGVLFEGCQGATADTILAYDNWIVINRGEDDYYGKINGKIFKWRYANKNVTISNNLCSALVGDTTNSAFASPLSIGVEATWDYDASADFQVHRYIDSTIHFINNTIVNQALDDKIRESAVGRSGVQCVRIGITKETSFNTSFNYTGTPDSIKIYYDSDTAVFDGTRIKWSDPVDDPFTFSSYGVDSITEYFYRHVSCESGVCDTSVLDSITTGGAYSWVGAGNIWRGNVLKGVERVYGMYPFDVGEVMNWLIDRDTVSIADSGFANVDLGTFYMNSIYTATGNIARDLYYGDNTAPDSITFGAQANEKNITIEKTCSLRVVDSEGSPISAAACSLSNNYGAYVLTGNSNLSGYVVGIVSIYYEAEDGVDSTGFNDFSIKAIKASDSAMGDSTITWDDGNFVMTLGATEGSSTRTLFRK